MFIDQPAQLNGPPPKTVVFMLFHSLILPKTRRPSSAATSSVVFALLTAALTLVCVPTVGAQVKKPPVPPKETPVTPGRPVSLPAPPTGAQAATQKFANVRGTVFDSLALSPLPSATVQFVAATDPSRIRSTQSDSLGQYRIDSLPTGIYLIGFIHDRVDQLGLDGAAMQVNIPEPGEVELQLSLPSHRIYAALKCTEAANDAVPGLFVGRVRTADGSSLEGVARVRVQYTETTVSSAGIERRRPLKVVEASSTGLFTVCGVPPDVALTTRAYAGGDSSGVVELHVPVSGVLVRDIFIGSAERVTVKSGAGSTLLLKGNSVVRGVVRDSSGKPLQGARLLMPGTGAEGTSASTGQFQLENVPGGTWMLEARAVGFEPQRVVVDATSENIGSTEIVLGAFAARIDTVKVQADKWTQRMAGFEARKKLGFGHFYDEAALEKRNARTLADFLRSTPGVSINPGINNRDQVSMRGVTGTGRCIPLFFVDGVKVLVPDGVIDNVVNQPDVRALEVYPGTGGTPIEFQNREGCGSIVIWTGGRRPASRPGGK